MGVIWAVFNMSGYTPLEMQLLKISDKYIEIIELDILINFIGTWSSGIAFLLLRFLMTCSISLGHVGCKKKGLFKLHWKDGGIAVDWGIFLASVFPTTEKWVLILSALSLLLFVSVPSSFEEPVDVLAFYALYSIWFLLFSTLRTNCYYYFQSAAYNNLLLTFN